MKPRHDGAGTDDSIEEHSAPPVLRCWLAVQLILSVGAWGVIALGIVYLV